MAGKTRIVITVDGKERLLFSVREDKEGQLYIFPKFAAFYTGREGNNSPQPIALEAHPSGKTKQQYYSVHTTPDQPEWNLIKHTIILEDGTSAHSYLRTTAIKKDKNFASLFLIRSKSVKAEKYLYIRKPGERVISLGKYRPEKRSLYYMVVLGPVGLQINKPPENDINIKHLDFLNFRLTILSSYTFLPSDTDGVIGHFASTGSETFRSEDLPLIQDRIAQGIEEKNVIYQFRLRALEMARSHFIYAGNKKTFFDKEIFSEFCLQNAIFTRVGYN